MIAQQVFDFFMVVLASGAVIEVWHKGSIFSTARAYVQAWHDGAAYGTVRDKIGELLLCPFCQSYHVPFYFYLLLLLCDNVSGTVSLAFRLVLTALAATRFSNIINGLLPVGMHYDADE